MGIVTAISLVLAVECVSSATWKSIQGGWMEMGLLGTRCGSLHVARPQASLAHGDKPPTSVIPLIFLRYVHQHGSAREQVSVLPQTMR
jgi:hypothetical protein